MATITRALGSTALMLSFFITVALISRTEEILSLKPALMVCAATCLWLQVLIIRRDAKSPSSSFITALIGTVLFVVIGLLSLLWMAHLPGMNGWSRLTQLAFLVLDGVWVVSHYLYHYLYSAHRANKAHQKTVQIINQIGNKDPQN